MQPRVQRDDPLLLRLPVHWESWVTVVLGLLLVPAGLDELVRGLHDRQWLRAVIGLVLTLFGLPLLAYSGREVLWRPTLRTRTLVLPRALHRARQLPLAEMSGVGLLYEIGGPRAGWFLRVWMTDGNTYGIGAVRSYARGHRPPDQPAPPDGTPRWHRPKLDWQRQADTPAGRATLAIAKQVLAVQGPSGPLAEWAEQTVAPSYGTYLAFWSPDGRMGWLEGEEWSGGADNGDAGPAGGAPRPEEDHARWRRTDR